MPTISIIVPIYNRRNNLRLCLAALDRQSVKDFEVVVADDGSTDKPFGVLEEYGGRFERRYCWHEHRGVRIALARNEGACIATGAALLFLDSDILLNDCAIGHYINMHTANPSVIVAGRYDWLPPQMITVYDVHANWHFITSGEMSPMEISGEPLGLQGIDPRLKNPNLFNSNIIQYGPYCLSLFSGNLLVPRKLYWDLGGYDAAIVGHGGEDAEFGMRAQKAGIPVIFSDLVTGYHVYHDRNQPQNIDELKKNVDYIEKKHDFKALGVRRGGDGESALEYRKDVKHV